MAIENINVPWEGHSGKEVEEFIKDVIQPVLEENKELFRNFIKEHLPNLKMTPCQATYLLWVDFSYYTAVAEENSSGHLAKKCRCLWMISQKTKNFR